MGKKYFDTKAETLESSILGVWTEAAKKVDETNKNDKSDDGDGLDAVQPKAVKKKFKDRKDKDVDNDGDVDDSDKFLHKRRKAVSKAMKDEGNAFGKALKAAKDNGEKTFVVAGKTYEVKEEVDLGEALEQYVVIAGPGDNNQKILDIFKGAGAALAAVFTFKNPIEAFAKAYAAVMAGGEAESAALQGTSDFQGDQSQKDFNDDSAKRDKVKGYNNMDTSEMGIGGNEGVGTGNATAMSYYAKQEEDRRYRDLGTGPKSNLSADDMMRMKGYTVSGMSDSQFDDATGYDDFSKEMGMVESQEFKSKVTKREVVKKNGKVVSDTGNITVIKGGPVTGDTINQSSTTQVTGDLDVNNTEFTQKMLNDAF